MLDKWLDMDMSSKKDAWVESRVEDQLGVIEDEFGLFSESESVPRWFNDYVDWESIQDRLKAEAEDQWDKELEEAKISAWEDKQND